MSLIPFDSNTFSLEGVAAGALVTVAGQPAHGFRLKPDPRNPGAYPVKLNVRGNSNKGHGIVFVTGPDWYKGHYGSLQAVSLGLKPAGDWICEFGIEPNSMILPVDNGLSRGPVSVWDEAQIATRAAPALVTDGIAIDGKSSYYGFFSLAAGDTFLGGNGDIWRLDPTTGIWAVVLSIPLPIGSGQAAIPVDALEIPEGRLLLASNAILQSGATQITAHLRVY